MIQRRLYHFFVLGILLIAACSKEGVCPYLNERLCDPAYRDSIANLEPDTSTSGFDLDTGVVLNNRVVYGAGIFDNVPRNAFLEYFTGFRCTNCPPASATAKNIKNALGSRVVLAFMHATSTFAAPTAAPPAPYSTDFRTPEGENFVAAFQISGLPNGVINRHNPGTGFSVTAADWLDRIEGILQQDAKGFVRFRAASLQPNGQSVQVQLAYRVLDGNTSDYNLTLAVIESGLVEAQKNGTQDIYPYTHDYVFRGNVNGMYGEELSEPSPVLAPTEAVFRQFSVNLDSGWNAENLRLIAFLSDRSSLEVIQAAEYVLTP